MSIVSIESMKVAARKFEVVDEGEIFFIELNRTGVSIENNLIPINYRARFIYEGKFSYGKKIWCAVPVRKYKDSKYHIDKFNNLIFMNEKYGVVKDVEIDTCDCSYFRKGKKVLNLNSNSRGNCKGCKFCVHNYPIYDKRVLKDSTKINSQVQLKNFC